MRLRAGRVGCLIVALVFSAEGFADECTKCDPTDRTQKPSFGEFRRTGLFISYFTPEEMVLVRLGDVATSHSDNSRFSADGLAFGEAASSECRDRDLSISTDSQLDVSGDDGLQDLLPC